MPVMKEGDHIAALEMLPEEYRDAREPKGEVVGEEAFDSDDLNGQKSHKNRLEMGDFWRI